jgi:2,3-bisphosphoglycerate-independent phosphoglycerate mutase
MTRDTLVLLILDGWGHLPASPYNAITQAKTPCWDRCWAEHPHVLLEASGTEVGLPEGQMGNSEVGHLTIGAGRIVDQDLTRIHKAIVTGHFAEHATLLAALNFAALQGRVVHCIGLLSPGGVHSHESHLLALLDAANRQSCATVFIHAILDGRDTPPQSAASSLSALTEACAKTGAQIASITGRYYAMDRDNRWERTEQAYQLLTEGKAPFHADSASAGLKLAYARGENDEFVQPTLITAASSTLTRYSNLPPQTIQTGDVVICFNFRADRMRQLSTALTAPDFTHFTRQHWPVLGKFVTFTDYAPYLKAEVLFPTLPLQHMLGDYFAEQNCTQLRLTETEKYAHVTFFFNGGHEAPFKNEERFLIPSEKVTTYDLAPAMRVVEITDKLVEVILDRKYDFILCNFANADMVGHTGKLIPTIQAIEAIDRSIARIVTAIEQSQGQLLITADHGNAECLFDAVNQQPHTAHTTSKVPLVYIGKPNITAIKNGGTLKDIAPSILKLKGLSIPSEMTGVPLFSAKSDPPPSPSPDSLHPLPKSI